MPRRQGHKRQSLPQSKYARRRLLSTKRGGKSEAELKHAKHIREKARRKRRRDEGWISQTTPEVKEVETNETV